MLKSAQPTVPTEPEREADPQRATRPKPGEDAPSRPGENDPGSPGDQPTPSVPSAPTAP